MSTNEVKPFHFRQCTEMSSSWREGRRQRMIEEMNNHDKVVSFSPSGQNFMHPLPLLIGFDLPYQLGMSLMLTPKLQSCLQEMCHVLTLLGS